MYVHTDLKLDKMINKYRSWFDEFYDLEVLFIITDRVTHGVGNNVKILKNR